ncbi:MAG TPA: DUF4440 domain-containing protein [Thermoanaerobaculia bacterium]
MNTHVERFLLAAVLVLAGCATASNSDIQPGDADKAIRAADVQLAAGMHAGNTDQAIAMYSDSAVLMPPNMPAMTGRDAIRQFFTGFVSAFNVDATFTPDDITQSGDLASERGHYEMTVTPKAGGPAAKDSGKYVVVWRKLNGQWRAVSDIYNSNVAMPH